MSENKKYYYMKKLKENFFSSERMVVLEMMPDGILYSNLLLKMYLMSLKHNGILLLHENLPHTPQTIATFTRHQIRHRRTRAANLPKTRLCRAADRWCVLYAGYPAAGRAILHRSGAKTPGTAAFTNTAALAQFKSGHLSTRE